jgi:hypothetical protein
VTEHCTPSIAEQWADRSGSVRRTNHPIDRLDLLDDAGLDGYRTAFPETSAQAFDAHELLLRAMQSRVAQIDEAARQALEDRIRERPLLTVVVYLAFGGFEVFVRRADGTSIARCVAAL